MNILVTGGAGYIGSHTCKALAEAGYTPITYDNLSTGYAQLVQWGPFVHGDIRDTSHLCQVMQHYAVTGIIHFAARSCVGESISSPNLYYANNVVGAQSLLDAMRLCDVKHIVVSSTCAVYGVPAQLPIHEETPRLPINPYGASKLMMERMLEDYHAAFGIAGAALRYFNAAGCDAQGHTGEWHSPETHLIPRVLMAAYHDLPALHVFGNDYPTPDGTCIRDYIHVTDLATAHVKALEYLFNNPCMLHLNLGTGRGYSVQEIITTASTLLTRPVPHTLSPRRPGDPHTLIADASRAQKTLAWQAKYSDLSHIISTAAQWYERCRSQKTCTPVLLA